MGRGGMAEVFLASATSSVGDRRLVALKRMHAGLSEDNGAIEMLIAEARLAMRFDHPNIATTYELGCHEGVYFFVMEYVDGVDLGTVARAAEALGERIKPALVAKIMAGAARALDHAHCLSDENGQLLGVVHRDVSPQNVLVSRRGAVKLIDFGVAKVASRIQQTMAGIIKGKYAYMSPEQASAEPVDPRSDVFSLGVCLWELLCGRPLFRGPEMISPFAILRAVREDPIPRVDSLVPSIGHELGALVAAALERDLPKRLASADVLASGLESWLARNAPDFDDEALCIAVNDLIQRAPVGTLPDRVIATPQVEKMSEEAFLPSPMSVVARSPLELAGADTDRRPRGRAPALMVSPPPLALTAAATAKPASSARRDLRPSRHIMLQLLWTGIFALIFALGWNVVATLKRLGKI